MKINPENPQSITQAVGESTRDWQDLEERLLKVTQQLGKGAWPRLARGLNALPPGRAAHLLEAGTPQQRTILWSLLDEQQEAVVAPLLSREVRQSLLIKKNRQELQELATRLGTEELVDIFDDLPDRITKDVLSSMDADRAQRIATIMAWPADTAGHLMTPEIPSLLYNSAVYLALQYVGEHVKEVHGVDRLPVTDRHNRYRGSVSIADLIAGQRTAKVGSLISGEVNAVRPTVDIQAIVEQMDGTEWGCLAVVDEAGKFLGVIRRGRIIDAALKAADARTRGQSGVDEDTFTPVLQSARHRGVWLMTNLVTAALAATVIGLFQDALEKAVALAVLMPIVTSMGGVAATQTLTITVRALALHQLHASNIVWLLNREISVGLLCGILLSIPVVLLTLAWFSTWLLAGLLAVAILLNLIIGMLAGVSIPVLMHRLKFDAAVSGAVVVTTVTDVAGFAIFLGLGTYFYI